MTDQPHDNGALRYDGPIEPGMGFIWQPKMPYAREALVVREVRPDGDILSVSQTAIGSPNMEANRLGSPAIRPDPAGTLNNEQHFRSSVVRCHLLDERSFLSTPAPAAQDGRDAPGWDVDGICNDHGVWMCKRCALPAALARSDSARVEADRSIGEKCADLLDELQGDYPATASGGGAREALRAQEDAEDARDTCECGGEGPWEECGPCSERFGRAICLRRTTLAQPATREDALREALNKIADLGSCAHEKRRTRDLLQDAIDIATGVL